MTAVSTEVAEQLASDKAAALINACLDQADAALMMRGRKAEDMRGTYRMSLFQHKQMLSTILTEIPDPELYPQLNDAIKEIKPEVFRQAIIEVGKTLSSRMNYFKALDSALIIGRYAYPNDVAWFHRMNPQLINAYQKEHPGNKVLAMPEDAQIKEECDFKAYKMGVFNRLQVIVDSLGGRSDTLFQPGDEIKCVVGNYLHRFLLEPLKALADNSSIKNIDAYLNEITEFLKHFLLGIGKLKPDNPDDSIMLSKKAIVLVNTIIDKTLIPLFKALLTELKEQSLAETFTAKATI